jgi:hypothetical protein
MSILFNVVCDPEYLRRATVLLQTKNRRDAMTFLVYWYGYGSVDINRAYSFVTKKSIKMYNEGGEMNLDKLPPKIQKKIEAKQSLTKKENETLLSFEEMRQDLAKAPEERPKGEWKELHEIEEDTMIMAAESSDVEWASDRSEKEQESGENGKPQAAKKITQRDKGQVDEIDFADDEISSDDSHDEEIEPPSSSEDDEDDMDFVQKKVKIKSPSKTLSRSGRKSLQKETAEILPSWITDAPGDLIHLSPDKFDRMRALEYFECAAAYFPEDKCNRESIARALEAAAYQWCQEQDKKKDTYWKKVHTIVAGICWKIQPGKLVAAIMAGEYESAWDVVNLPSEEMYLRCA